MSSKANPSQADSQVQQIRGVFAQYKQAHPKAVIDVRRQNPVVIRIPDLGSRFQEAQPRRS